jgi:hypothetical protein
MVQAPGFIRGINPKSQIENRKSNDWWRRTLRPDFLYHIYIEYAV